jgi:ABC-2 type transport system permease protein
MLPIIFLVPLVQLLILVNAATLEMKHIKMMIVDNDLSTISRKVTEKFIHSPFYKLVKIPKDEKEAEKEMLMNNTDLIILIPQGFEQQLKTEGSSSLQFQIDAINGMKAGLINAYTIQIINRVNLEIKKESGNTAALVQIPANIQINYSYWYNSELKFKFFMVPGILVLLVTIISMFLASLNLVREKEMGTIEQINVTPIRKYQFIIGKLIPFWIIALLELSLGLILGRLLFNMPIEGSLLLLFGFAAIYLIAILAIGLLISTLAQTQQQALFLNFFFLITFILMSGLFTPAESMPHWAQHVNIVNPLAYFMRVIRMILLKGSGFTDILHDFAGILVYSLLMLGLATWRYRKIA